MKKKEFTITGNKVSKAVNEPVGNYTKVPNDSLTNNNLEDFEFRLLFSIYSNKNGFKIYTKSLATSFSVSQRKITRTIQSLIKKKYLEIHDGYLHIISLNIVGDSPVINENIQVTPQSLPINEVTSQSSTSDTTVPKIPELVTSQSFISDNTVTSNSLEPLNIQVVQEVDKTINNKTKKINNTNNNNTGKKSVEIEDLSSVKSQKTDFEINEIDEDGNPINSSVEGVNQDELGVIIPKEEIQLLDKPQMSSTNNTPTPNQGNPTKGNSLMKILSLTKSSIVESILKSEISKLSSYNDTYIAWLYLAFMLKVDDGNWATQWEAASSSSSFSMPEFQYLKVICQNILLDEINTNLLTEIVKQSNLPLKDLKLKIKAILMW
jgi:hypothetical protein